MRAFVQKLKATQQASSVRSTIHGRRHFGQSDEVKSIRHLQQTLGNQAVRRLLEINASDAKENSTAGPIDRFAHQFSRIPIHPPAAGPIQTKLTINEAGDEYEQEADHIAEQVMRMPDPQLQRACVCGGACPRCQTHQADREPDRLRTKRVHAGNTGLMAAAPSFHEVLAAPGQPLDSGIRGFMEPRFGHDFSRVRVHTDTHAAQINNALSARAFTYGSDVYFNRGEYSTQSTEGKRLLAHELTHVIQQAGGVNLKIQRECSDPDFCKPYTSATEIANAKAYLLDYFVPVLESTFGSDVGSLWRRFLSRKPGDSLSPTVFNTEGNSIHDSFSDNNYIHDETDRMLDLVAGRLDRGYGNVTQPITNFLSRSEMELSTDFANPFTIPGNIAGGIGSSDAGMDSRRITWGQVSFDITDLPFGKLVNIEVILGFEVKDAIDFCPGDCGAILEQSLATIKMSRLEASGEAYDVPYVVRFTGPRRNKRVVD
jgi:hypothetical protein